MDGYIKLMVSSIIWGTLGVFARWSDLSPILFAFYRSFIAVLVLLVIFNYSRKRIELPSRIHMNRLKLFSLLILSGVCKAVGMLCFFTAINLTTLSQTLFIYYLGPVLLVLVSPLFLKEKSEPKSMMALGVALTGFILIIVSGAQIEIIRNVHGITYAFLGAVCFTSQITIARVLKEMESQLLTFFQMLIAACVIFPFIGFNLAVNPKALFAVLVVGIFHTAFAYINYYEGLKEVKIQHAGILLYLDPLAATILGGLVFQEIITSGEAFGGMLIIAAGIIITVTRW